MEDSNFLKENCEDLGTYLTEEEWNKVKSPKYPGFEEAKEKILRLEALVAKSIVNFHEKSNQFNSDPVPQLNYDLEWFLTWRAKLARFPHIVWCDGSEVTEYEKIDEQQYQIKANVLLGPESDISTLFECELRGIIEVEPGLNKLHNYHLQITYQGQEYFICKV